MLGGRRLRDALSSFLSTIAVSSAVYITDTCTRSGGRVSRRRRRRPWQYVMRGEYCPSGVGEDSTFLGVGKFGPKKGRSEGEGMGRRREEVGIGGGVLRGYVLVHRSVSYGFIVGIGQLLQLLLLLVIYALSWLVS